MRRPHRASHAAIWAGLAIAIPGLMIAAFVLRIDPGQRVPAERLAPPGVSAPAE